MTDNGAGLLPAIHDFFNSRGEVSLEQQSLKVVLRPITAELDEDARLKQARRSMA